MTSQHTSHPDSGSLPSILVIDADERAGAALQAMAAESGLQVRSVHTLRDGLDALGSGDDIDCVLVDLALPDAGDGVDAVAAVVASFPSIPLVAVTDDEDDDTAVAAVALGAQNVLIKRQLDAPGLVRTIRIAQQRKKVEWSFFRTDQRHRRILDTAAVGVWRGDTAGTTTYMNARLRSMLDLGDVASVPRLTDIVHAADRERVEAMVDQAPAVASGHAWVTLRATGGRTMPVSMHLAAVTDDGGDAKELVAMMAPATDPQAGAEDDAQAALQTMAAIVRCSDDAMVMLDQNFIVLSWNEAAAALFGYEPEEAIGQSATAFMPPDEQPETISRLTRALAGETVRYVATRRRKDGAVKHVQVALSPALDATGSVKNIAVVVRDITDLHEAVLAKEKSDALLRTVADNTPVIVAALDTEGRLVHLDGRGLDAIGLDPDDLLGRSVFETFADAAPDVLEDVSRALAHEESASVTHYRGRAWDVRYTPVADPDGASAGVVAVALEVTDRIATERRLSQLVEHVPDIVSIHHADGSLQWASPSATRVLGFPSGQGLEGEAIASRVFADDLPALVAAFKEWSQGRGALVEYRMSDVTGRLRSVQSVGVNLLDHPAIRGILVTTRDVTDSLETGRDLERSALRDSLTDLPNRTLLLNRLGQLLATTRRDPGIVAVAFIDIDHFKLINDTLGHESGDDVIREVARVLRRSTRPGDTVARISGDEFAVCLAGIHVVDDAVEVTERLLADIATTRRIGDHPIHISATAGLVISEGGVHAEQLIADAELAMYRGKQLARGSVEVFDEEARRRVMGRIALQHELRDALERDEFRLFFQPQVQVDTGEITSFEALLRWEHPARGLLTPAAFIDVAEESRLIEPIGRWVLQESCRQIAAWRRQLSERRLTVSVNLSARQLSDPRLPELVNDAITGAGIEPSALCLELTESMLMEDAESAVAVLRHLKESGVRLAIDDFGTGYSSLAYLKRFPIDQLKVDRSFVSGLGRDLEDYVIVSAIVNLAKTLGVEVVAEGVENERHLAELESIGCPLAQGYLWSPPIPSPSVPAMLNRRTVARKTRPVAASDKVPAAASQAIDVVSLLTHELRAPLTVIKGYAETMQAHVDETTTPLVAQASAAIARNVTNLDELITTLSDVNALETGSLPLRRDPIDINELLQATIADHRHLFPEHRIHIDARAATGFAVHADASRIQQVLLNLLTNAAKFGPPTPGIEIELNTSPTDVEVSVIDHGPGVPPELAREIFRKFFRIDHAKKGSGLGLYIARALARAHGGELLCRRAPQGGAEFVLTLPRAGASTATEAGVSIAADAAAGHARDSSPAAGLTDRSVAAMEAAREALAGATVSEHVVAAGIALAKSLGGTTMPARVANESATPHDISCGLGEALLVGAPPASPERAMLDLVMPTFIDEASTALLRVDDELADASRVDAVTGFPGRRLVSRWLSRLQPGATVVLLRIEHVADEAVETRNDLDRALARVLRELAPTPTMGRFGEDQIAVLFGPDDAANTDAFVGDLRAAWRARRPRQATLAIGVARVGADGAQVAVVMADAATRGQAE